MAYKFDIITSDLIKDCSSISNKINYHMYFLFLLRPTELNLWEGVWVLRVEFLQIKNWYRLSKATMR
jgi:hypothetical protein